MRRLSIKSPLVNVMCRAVLESTKTLSRDFLEISNLLNNRQGLNRFIKVAENKVTRALHESLLKSRLDFGFIIEGQDEIKGSGAEANWTWIIDPIDGTNNLAHGIPHFACSICAYDGKQLMAAIVYDIIKDEMFYAAKGEGAFLDDSRLRVSSNTDLSSAMISTRTYRGCLPQVQKLIGSVMHMRSFGSTSLDLSYVAAGRVDCAFFDTTRPWDIAAGMLLVSEAGGVIYNDKGQAFDTLSNSSLIAGNHDLSTTIKEILT